MGLRVFFFFFELVVHAVPEDWGYESPTIADKWIR